MRNTAHQSYNSYPPVASTNRDINVNTFNVLSDNKNEFIPVTYKKKQRKIYTTLGTNTEDCDWEVTQNDPTNTTQCGVQGGRRPGKSLGVVALVAQAPMGLERKVTEIRAMQVRSDSLPSSYVGIVTQARHQVND
ncbi:hypothetical protein FQA39_LY12201 [Lamprigera yunnana]|nr:hypothetical protein FQA39_LY12201 [Lamprigera yunnana]